MIPEPRAAAQPTNKKAPDDFVAEVTAKLDRAARMGQKILAPFLYLGCVGAGILLSISISASWLVGAIVGLMAGWVLVRASYFPIKWGLLVLGIYAVGSAL